MANAIVAASVLSVLSLGIWIYLLTLRGGFWRGDQRLAGADPAPASWPAVVAVVPARNEADLIARSLGSLLAQDYPGPFTVVLADDHSTDRTAAIAGALPGSSPAARHPLEIVAADPLPAGWSGKLWAQSEGLRRAAALTPEARYVLFTDADIAHDPGSLRRLVAKAEVTGLDLVSLMVRLDRRGVWAALLIPAFVFFFQKLYPFPWINDRRRRTAGAAGGCVLVRRCALAQAGGLDRIRSELIDDCALARIVKDAGSGGIWLGLTDTVHSLRRYDRLKDIRDMVVRTAYTQLRHSPLLLVGTLLGMVLTYLVPPLAVLSCPLHGSGPAAAAGLAAWLLMAVAYRPTLRLYGMPAVAGVLLPVAGLLYSVMVVESALRHWRGRGGQWKGRVHSATSAAE